MRRALTCAASGSWKRKRRGRRVARKFKKQAGVRQRPHAYAQAVCAVSAQTDKVYARGVFCSGLNWSRRLLLKVRTGHGTVDKVHTVKTGAPPVGGIEDKMRAANTTRISGRALATGSMTLLLAQVSARARTARRVHLPYRRGRWRFCARGAGHEIVL